MQHGRELSELEPSFGDCPSICQATRERRREYCSGCEVKRLEDEFRERASAELAEFGDARWSFDNLLDDFYTALGLENGDPSRWTRIAARFIGIIRSERNRLDQINSWIARQRSRGKD